MADVEIRGKISVDTGNTQKSVNEMLESIKQTKAALKDAKVGSEEYKAAQASLKKQTEDLNKTMDQSSGSFSKLKGTLGQVVPGLDAAAEGAAGFGKQLWLLVANPIVAIIAGIVAALTLLYKAFVSVEAGADKVNAIMGGLSQVFEEIRNRALKLIDALGKIFSGDFQAGFDAVGNAASGMGDAMVDAFERGKQAAEKADEIADSLRMLALTEAKVSAAMAKNKEAINDENVGYNDKKKAIQETRKALTELGNTRQKLLDDDVKNFEKEHKLEEARKKMTDAEFSDHLQKVLNADQIQEYINKSVKAINSQEQLASQSRQLQRSERSIDAAERTKAQAAQKAIDDANKKAADEKIANDKRQSEFKKQTLQAEIDTVASLTAQDLATKKSADEEEERINQAKIDRASSLAKIRKYEYDQEKARQEAALNFKIQLLSQEAQAIEMFGSVLQQLAGKSKALAIAGIVLEKAGAIGRILISGYQANAKSIAASPLTLGQPWVGIQNVMTGIQIAGTVAAAGKAISAMGGSDSGGGSQAPNFSASAPLAPQQASTSLNAGSIQGVGNAAAGGVGRSFVLDADIKSNQERQARIARAARLG